MAKRYLGQNFLHDLSIIKRIIQVAQITEDDLVVEIGPGYGNMTKFLAEKAKDVIAIELDEQLFEKLKIKLADYHNIEIIHGDALKYPYENLPDFKIVANIPYYITTPIIFRLLKIKQNLNLQKADAHLSQNLKTMTLTVQKEVAERIIAKPGGKNYGVLSIMVQYYTNPQFKFIIPKKAFKPIPKVDSAVIHLEVLPSPSVNVNNENFFMRIVKTTFSQRRKILSNSLKGIRKDVKEWLTEAGIDPHRRPESLSIEEFARLSNIHS